MNSPVRKTAFLGGGAITVVVLFLLSLQTFASWFYARGNTVSGLEHATQIDPGDADYLTLLGSATQAIDYGRSVSYLERAVRANPHSARAWLTLASSYALTGQHEKQRNAILTALREAPKDIDVEWEAANLFLLEGDDRTGLGLMRDVVTGDEGRSLAAMQTVYHVSGGDIPKTIAALPPTSKARLGLMTWLVDHDHQAEADQVWPSIASAQDKFRSADALFYVDSLIGRHEVSRARTVWSELAARDPELGRHLEAGNAIINGDFEDSLLNKGFDWHWTLTGGVTVTIDTTVFHEGNRSLSLQFDAQNLSDAGVYQIAAVEPGARYSLHAQVHSEELESANGVRLAVVDYYSNQAIYTSDEVLGSVPWRDLGGEFVVPSATQLVRIRFIRSPSNGIIRGRIWFDDLQLEKH